MPLLRPLAALVPSAALAAIAGAAAPTGNPSVVTAMPGLVAFWTFGEEPGQPRRSNGPLHPHPLPEVGGPVARAAGGSVAAERCCTLGFTYDCECSAHTSTANSTATNSIR